MNFSLKDQKASVVKRLIELASNANSEIVLLLKLSGTPGFLWFLSTLMALLPWLQVVIQSRV